MRYTVVTFLVIGTVLGLGLPAQGQSIRGIYSAEADKLFAEGVLAYRNGEFASARDAFVRLLEQAVNQHSSAGQLMLGKSYFCLGDFEDALAAARGLPRKYADSRYVPAARLLAGDTYFKLKRYYEAAAEYGRLLATPAPLETQAQAAERLSAIDKNGYLSAKAMESIELAVGAERMRDARLYGRVRWYRRLGWDVEAALAAQIYADSVGSTGVFNALLDGSDIAVDEQMRPIADYDAPIDLDVDPTADFASAKAKLGLLLPMSGPYRAVAEELYTGVQMANQDAGEPFDLIVADTGTDFGDLPINIDAVGNLSEHPGSGLLRVVRGARSLVEQDVQAIIGPLFSSSCVPAAVVAEAAGVPLIAPLSQQSGLDSVGSYIFQLNTIPETQGQLLAEHATLVLGHQNIVLLTPLSDYGWSFAREFNRVVEENGGHVVHSDWYVPSETKDFRRVFEEIRRIGFELMPAPEDTLAAADSLEWMGIDSTASAPSFLTELLEGLEEEVVVEENPEEEEAPPDSSEIFIDTIDGIVVVVENFEDAKTIAPQVSFYRLETSIVGNDIWYDPEGVRQMRASERKYVDGAIVASAHREERPEERNFVDDYRRRFHRDPQYAAYGYDAAQLVIGAWQDSGGDRVSMRDWLASVRDFAGVSGHISFSEQRRTNVDLTLLKIDGDRFRPLESTDLPDLSVELEDALMPPAEIPMDDESIGD
jgi:ABC-type branched-subunit amino acid transport system substrate-binding protein